MSPRRPPQVIQVGHHQIALPDGVTATDWALERVRVQNPRIRIFLGCLDRISGVLESNYALLHCSPERLRDIWSRMREVSGLIQVELGPLLQRESHIPSLESARQSARIAYQLLTEDVLAPLDRFPADPRPDELGEIRKLLCVSIGQVHVFLQETFGEIVAADPRSVQDADYFLSKRFPRDVEEAEWLYTSVERLSDYLGELSGPPRLLLVAAVERITDEQLIPDRAAWNRVVEVLDDLVDDLTPKLKELLALRGIRYDEMEVVDRYATALPTRCAVAKSLYEAAAEATREMDESLDESTPGRAQNVRDLLRCQRVFGNRLAAVLEAIERSLLDLAAFIPLWLDGISRRRALMLRRFDATTGETPTPPDAGDSGDVGDAGDGDRAEPA